MNSKPNQGDRWQGITLRPLDVLFFRDGRPFADNVRNTGGLPTPQTLAGALRTAMLESQDLLAKFLQLWKKVETRDLALSLCPNVTRAQFRGPWLMRGNELFLPAPLDLIGVTDSTGQLSQIDRLRPGAPAQTAGVVPRPLTTAHKDGKPIGQWISLTGLRRYLDDSSPKHGDIVSAADLFGFETRVGIGIDPDRLTTGDGEIYSTRLLRLSEGVSFYAEVSAQAPICEGPIRFGGEGRCVTVARRDCVDWSSKVTASSKQLWYLATPGLFGGWKLPDTAGTIVSAAVGNPLAISGWDNARNGPRPTRFAAPAGSVYYIDSPVTESSPRAFGNFTEEGFGLALPGIWKET